MTGRIALALALVGVLLLAASGPAVRMGLASFTVGILMLPAAGALGNLGRNTERGPGVNNLDLALFKNVSITNGVRLQFRLESFNALNHTQFATVSTNLTAANFGVVTATRPARINQLGLKLLF